jgi:hypothetical protein
MGDKLEPEAGYLIFKITVKALEDMAYIIDRYTDGKLKMTHVDNGDGTGRIEVRHIVPPTESTPSGSTPS